MNLTGAVLFGLSVGFSVGAFVYRDAASLDSANRLSWALGTASVVGVGAGASYLYSGRVMFAATSLVQGETALTNPFTVPFAYVFLTAAVVALSVVGYRRGVRAVSSRPAERV